MLLFHLPIGVTETSSNLHTNWNQEISPKKEYVHTYHSPDLSRLSDIIYQISAPDLQTAFTILNSGQDKSGTPNHESDDYGKFLEQSFMILEKGGNFTGIVVSTDEPKIVTKIKISSVDILHRIYLLWKEQEIFSVLQLPKQPKEIRLQL